MIEWLGWGKFAEEIGAGHQVMSKSGRFSGSSRCYVLLLFDASDRVSGYE